jgi:hypothetical protein
VIYRQGGKLYMMEEPNNETFRDYSIIPDQMTAIANHDGVLLLKKFCP